MRQLNGEALYRQAATLHMQGDLLGAVTLYEKIIPNSSEARFLIAYARCLQELGRWKKSIPYLKRGVELKPHYCEAAARLLLANAYLQTRQIQQAVIQWRVVEKMPPEYPDEAEPAKAAAAYLKLHAKG